VLFFSICKDLVCRFCFYANNFNFQVVTSNYDLKTAFLCFFDFFIVSTSAQPMKKCLCLIHFETAGDRHTGLHGAAGRESIQYSTDEHTSVCHRICTGNVYDVASFLWSDCCFSTLIKK